MFKLGNTLETIYNVPESCMWIHRCTNPFGFRVPTNRNTIMAIEIIILIIIILRARVQWHLKRPIKNVCTYRRTRARVHTHTRTNSNIYARESGFSKNWTNTTGCRWRVWHTGRKRERQSVGFMPSRTMGLVFYVFFFFFTATDVVV